MGIFRRERRKDAAEDVHRGSDEPNTAEGDAEPREVDEPEAAGAADAAGAAGRVEAAEERFHRARGPFDAAEVDDEVERIDLGSLRVPLAPGMELRLELDQEQQSVVSAHAVLGDSGVQLQAFAAPRTLGVWPDIRSEIADSVLQQKGSAEVVEGPLGLELVAGIPTRGADGRTTHAAVRFLGVDGPRWFLRAVINGAAAKDPAKAAPLVDLVRGVVVVRDDEARPPREALPLRMPIPPEPPSPAAEPEAAGSGPAASPSRSAADLRPFERGPEITEVR